MERKNKEIEHKIKKISLKGDRILQNLCKKRGLELFNPQGPWNGYGYERLPLAVKLKNRSELLIFRNLQKKAREKREKQNQKPKKDPREAWVQRLSKLTGISIEEAEEIAEEKEEYLQNQIQELEDRQAERYSTQRQKIINKLMRSNPLRRITGEEHAQAILRASERHNRTNYEALLKEGKEMAEIGKLDKNEVREYARRRMREY